MNRSVLIAGAVLLALVAAVLASPKLRQQVMAYLPESLKAQFTAASAEITETPEVTVVADELYTWVDKNGVTHFSQRPAHKKAEKVTYDGGRVTPLPKADAEVVEKLKAIADTVETEKAAQEEVSVTQQGSETLHNLRRELQENQQKMQATKSR